MLAFYQSTLVQLLLTGKVPANYNNPVPTSYGGPLVITVGGTYTGNWESTDGSVPAVSVQTSEPVIILNANMRGAGNLIHCSSTTPNIKVLNCRGYGGTPGTLPRRFFICGDFIHVQIEHCYMESTAGILIAGNYLGNDTAEQTIKIKYNKVLNIDGRLASGYAVVQFLQTNTVRQNEITVVNEVWYYDGIPYMEVTWNDIRNQPGLSHVEDVMNFYNTRGEAIAPILVSDNFIHGAYYWDWQSENFTGSGMIADSPGADKGSCTTRINFERNYVVGSNNNDFGVAGGTHINLIDNVGLNKGYIDSADATRLGLTPASAQSELRGYPGNIYVHSDYVVGVTSNITETNHTEGIVGEKSFSVGPLGWRNDGDLWDTASFGTITNRNTLAGTIDEALEQSYRTLWENRKTNNNIHIGVTP